MNIIVGVSGGVDSAVALNILKNEGHNVLGVMMKIYDDKGSAESGSEITVKTLASSCYGVNKDKEIQDAKRVCELAGCDFILIDAVEEFEKKVFCDFKNQYLNGFTPNPCIACNKLIKFGFFLEKAFETARHKGFCADKFATGHYVKNIYNEKTARYELKMGKNRKKDQSYFLCKLSQETLAKVIFPLGDFDKTETRELAQKFNIPVASKRDSQDFYKGDYADILQTKAVLGNIVDTNGNILGQHEGIFNYTVGQRKGLKIAYSEPLYVLGFNKEKNEVIVGTKAQTYKKGLIADDVNWVSIENPCVPFRAQAKIRSASEPKEVLVTPFDNKIKVEFVDSVSSIALGQTAAIYKEDMLLAGGRIVEAF